MSKTVRLSPSGPNIVNSDGGPFDPGHGARIRLVEASTTITGTITIPTTPTELGNPMGGTAYRLLLDAPDPGHYFRVTTLVDVLNPTTNANAAVELYVDLSTDGASWTEYASNSHLIGFSGARQIRCDMKLKLGSAVGVQAGQANMYVRTRIGASSGGGVVLVESSATPGDTAILSVGSALMQLEECF